MAKQQRKKRRWIFPLCLLIYAVVFLGFTAWGLDKFWDYMEAYELSQPKLAMDAYMQQVDKDYLIDNGAAAVIKSIDLNIQSEQACREYIANTLTGEISYAQRLSECTDTRLVYMVLCGDRAVCKVTLKPQAPDEYGFTPWQVVGEDFDFSYITTSTASITVPHNYPVYIGDACLDSSYLIMTRIHYEPLEEFYNSYDLPYMVTYQSGPFLGELEMRVTDPEGLSVTIDENTDMNVFLSNCTDEETAQLEPLVEAFVSGYVDFTSCAGGNPERNYNNLSTLIVKKSDLANRLYEAIGGLTWINDRHSEISSLTVNYYVNLGESRYLCDVTYEVDTMLHTGPAHETASLKLIIVITDDGPKVESMTTY